jgi:LPS-assembly protein
VVVQSFQTLQDPAAPVTPPYNMLPQIKARWTRPTGPASRGAEARNTRISRNLARPHRRSRRPVSVRALDPARQLLVHQCPRRGPALAIRSQPGHGERAVAAAERRGAHYQRRRGLYFERDWTAFGTSFVQTLEPRAMYTYIPFRQQSQLPVFDTVQDDFNFAQLFIENRSSGTTASATRISSLSP